jgi:hypothetical protein
MKSNNSNASFETISIETKNSYARSDGILNLLCWLTIYPSKSIAMFFRQLLLCGCVITKQVNNRGIKKVYCSACGIGDMDMDRNIKDYWICCCKNFGCRPVSLIENDINDFCGIVWITCIILMHVQLNHTVMY